MKHTILFLAANPADTDRLALDREAHDIHAELERTGHRHRFAFVTRWAVEPLDLLRELRKLRPTVVHFSGHGSTSGTPQPGPPRRDIVDPGVTVDAGAAGAETDDLADPQGGLVFQGPDGSAGIVSAAAMHATVEAAGESVRLVVLNACYSDPHAQPLLACVDCVVGMTGPILDDAAREFAVGFYGGLGDQQSVDAAFRQARAAILLAGLDDDDRPRLAVRAGVDARRLVLAADFR